MQLRAEGLCKSYRRREVVRNVSLSVASGEIVGLLGPNGAGKTTVFGMVVGLLPSDSGRIFLGDEDITGEPMFRRARRGIAYLPQEPSVFRRMSVADNLMAILETLPLPRAERVARMNDLLAEFSLTERARQNAATLSGGERRRLEIARALVIAPKFLLLDEPFAGIDPVAVLDIQRIMRGLKARGIGVLVTDHNVRETLSITDRAYIINHGEVYRADTPVNLVADAEVRRIYLGEGFSL